MYIFHLYGLMHGEHRYKYIQSTTTELEAQNVMRSLILYKDIIIISRRKCLDILPTAFLDQQTIIIINSNNLCGAI